jgi:hypothetical protein
MSEIQGAPAPTVVAQPAAVVAPPVGKVVTVDDLPPEALSKRIDQAKHAERTALLAELGIADPAEAKTAIAAHKAALEAAKTDAEKLASLNLTVANQAKALNVAVAQAASKITPEQKAAVDAIAGQDQVTWLNTYAALAPTWGTAALPVNPASLAAPTVPVASVATTPTSTAPAAPAPAPTGTISPPNHATIYQSLTKTNPFAAAAYVNQHGDACFKT